ncbi:hypothetical protein N7457_003529 [Penicillium paradoxum]|uniref:uncharacterized protein n=1 Tax=Penicillium paradoxum TaxID=176176 RepID=UPI002549B6C6|nr:uncharacterized protein N7457_003529 [Penicillium paradoxum]KAJ5788539.1 hypothetical protein N7457_003529 [Penicillium paradoxum]
MLERATGCLENAGRRLLQDSNGVVRSKNSLPSHIWNYNAAGTDTPNWFLALLHASGQRSSPVLNTQHEGRGSSDGIGPSLDFLYPRQGQALTVSHLFRTQKRTGSRRKRSHLSFSRSYVSISSLPRATPEASSSHEDIPERAQEPQNPESPQEDGKANADLHAFLQKNGTEFDKAWVLYIAAGYPSKLRSALCAYLSKSRNRKDQRRTWELFKLIGPQDRTELDYKNVMKSQLFTEDGVKPHRLQRICNEIIRTPMPFAPNIIGLALVHMVKTRQWKNIDHVWKMILQAQPNSQLTLSSLLLQFNRFEFLDYSLARHLLTLADHLKDEKKPSINDFARRLVDRFIMSPDMVKLTPITTLLPLLRQYCSLGLLSQIHYLELIKLFHLSEERSEFVKSVLLYRQYRLDLPDALPSKRVLHRMIGRFSELQMTDCLPYFLDEEAHFWEKPSVFAYREALIGFSRVGDAPKVHELFNSFLADHPTFLKQRENPDVHRLVAPLLVVHARLGDVQETRRQFQRISAELGIKPNTVCWNILLLAHTTAGDLSGAVSVFSQMQRNKMRLNSYSFGTLMGHFAKRRDIETVRRLLKEAQSSKVQITRPILDTVVQVYLNNGELTQAEQLIEKSWNLADGGSPLRMWNSLLAAYAFRVSKFSFRRILDRIGKLGLTPDAMTYGAIMLAYVYAMQPDRARATLRTMHQTGLKATEYHYNILLLGYVNQRNRDMVHVIFQEMQTRFGRVAMDASLLNLRMQIARDLENANDSQMPLEDIELENAQKTLVRSITQFNAHPSPVKHRSASSFEGSSLDAFTAKHYQLLIQAYGTEAGPEKALQLLNQYMRQRQSDDALESLPIIFIRATMLAALRAHKFKQVEECWGNVLVGVSKTAVTFDINELFPSPSSTSALQRPAESSRSLTSSTSTKANKSKILPAHRFTLDTPLSLYLRSLACRDEYEKIHKVVAEVQAAGFALTGFNWSTYIRMLATSENYNDITQAFRMFEDKFIAHFPGWRWFLKGYGVRPINAPVTLLHLEGRWGATKSRRMMGKLARKQWRKIEPDYMHPHYPTMVQLASTLKRLRHTSIMEGNGHLASLYKIAPKTIDALAAMPSVRDKYQATILRGTASKKDIIASPIKLHSTPSGALGLDSKVKKRTFDDAIQEPFELKKQQYPERSAVDESNLTGFLTKAQEQALSPLSSILPREDRIELETELYEQAEITSNWLSRNARHKKAIARALANKKPNTARFIRRYGRRARRAYSNKLSPERRLFDKSNRKWKLKTPAYRLFKPDSGLHVKVGQRKSTSKYKKRSWTFK